MVAKLITANHRTFDSSSLTDTTGGTIGCWFYIPTAAVDHDFIKKAAFKRANLEVARVMTHTKQAPKGWSNTESRYQERLGKADARISKAKKNLTDKIA